MIRTAVQRPVAVLMIFTGLVLIGVLSFGRLPVDLLPSINYPNLTVITSYGEVPADDLTRLITQPLEERITCLAGVRQVISRTREGVSTITGADLLDRGYENLRGKMSDLGIDLC